MSVYNTALTPAQVVAQYTAAGYSVPTLPGSTDPYARTVLGNSPSMYWRMGEQTGTTLTDLSGPGAASGGGQLFASTPATPAARSVWQSETRWIRHAR